jgi:hypothetical protein
MKITRNWSGNKKTRKGIRTRRKPKIRWEHLGLTDPADESNAPPWKRSDAKSLPCPPEGWVRRSGSAWSRQACRARASTVPAPSATLLAAERRSRTNQVGGASGSCEAAHQTGVVIHMVIGPGALNETGRSHPVRIGGRCRPVVPTDRAQSTVVLRRGSIPRVRSHTLVARPMPQKYS